MDALPAPFDLPYVQRGLAEVLLLSAGAGVLGCWIVLRGLAFYSHAVGSAAFPGLVLADGLGFSAPLGALAAAGAFALLIAALGGRERLGPDATTAVGLAGMLALGVILSSDVFHSGSGVETLLFGSLLLVEPRDLVLAGLASAGAVAASLTVGQAWLARGFDPAAARALGIRGQVFDALLLALVALVVVAALSALGALLVAALVVVPAATVRLWTDRLVRWQVLTVGLVAAEGIAGLALSVELNAPPGATIATLAGAVFALAAGARALRARAQRVAAVAATGALLVLGLGACGSDGDSGVRVVATTTQVADWARAVSGDGFDVHQILRPNTDPHDYEPRPDDVEALASADLILRSGGDLDDWVRDAARDAGSDAVVVDLSRYLSYPRRVNGELDPHWWHDPRNVRGVTATIAGSLFRVAPDKRSQIERRAQQYFVLVQAVDLEIARCMRSIPPAQRKLVTDHDAFGYLADRYGLEVVGTVIPARSTQAQPSAGELADLAQTIEREHVRAVFPEGSVSADAARAIARETGADASHVLYGDTLGPDGSRGETYIGMMISNADSIVRGLTGKRCSAR
jgi:ABC-type Zn uptake system ZnuABC Zn-binding protein ZnuA/ABC-type Mn2+/Zn2+ transport system permease subunit